MELVARQLTEARLTTGETVDSGSNDGTEQAGTRVR